jgi:pimeloyl-ACP methyl ester carboxylesterase
MLYFRQAGSKDKPAIVLLHGGGISSRMWQPQFERLNDFYLIAPDLPEQGESFDVRPFTLEDSASRVAEIIRITVPSGKAHLVGNSLGGAVILTMLRTCPDVVDRALVQGAAAKLARWLGNFSISLLWIYRFYTPERMAEATMRQLHVPEQYHDLIFPDLVKTGTKEFSRTTIQALMDMELPLQNTRPLLTAVGEQETPAAKDAAHKMVRLIPNTRGVIVPGVHHLMNLQNPDLYCDMVRAWVTDQPLPASLKPIS